jgi:DNA repair protein RadC
MLERPAVERAPLPSETACELDLHAGHRKRLRARFLAGGETALADYELLELILFGANARRDMKPLGSASCQSSARSRRSFPHGRSLAKVDGVGEAVISQLKIVEAAAHRFARGQVKGREVLSSWSGVLDYCRTAMAFGEREELRVLFLDKRNRLIEEERQQVGTVDHTPVYPREV